MVGWAQVQAMEDGIINLLHYEDAASAVVAALLKAKKDTKPRILLISDDKPLTR